MSVKLNLGCWWMKKDGWINIDADPKYGDVVMDAFNLGYPDNYADEIYAGHLLEHTPNPLKALTEWNRVLKIGGYITVVVPDMAKCLVSPMDFENLRADCKQTELDTVAYGLRNRPGEFHYHIYTETILVEYMNKFFKDVTVLETPIKWETRVGGVK